MHEQFGRYILLERIAIGGMAEIFKAKAPGLGGFEKVLAIKRLHPRYSEDADFIEMLIDEARISVELSHSNIAQIFDLGKVEDHYFIAMEFIDGRDLYRTIKRLKDRRTPFPIDGAAWVAAECASGLDYAHRKKDARGRPLNIIHRDVSPQNVLLSYDGDTKLVDFGIAKAALRAYETETGIIKGKFYYMSPEQARGEPLDHRTDVFSLGIVLYEMLTGDLLYKDEDDASLLSRVRKADIAPPSLLRPEIPQALERIVMKTLARDREDRYPSALHVQKDLHRFLRSTGSTFSKARASKLMREIFLDETMPEESEEYDQFLIRSRAEFGLDRHSLIAEIALESAALAGQDARWDAEEPTQDITAAEQKSPRDDLETGIARGERSELIQLDSREIHLVEEEKSTVNMDGPPAGLAEGFDSIESAGPPADLDYDPFDEESTRAVVVAVPPPEPAPPPRRRAEPEPAVRARRDVPSAAAPRPSPEALAFAAAPTPLPERPPARAPQRPAPARPPERESRHGSNVVPTDPPKEPGAQSIHRPVRPRRVGAELPTAAGGLVPPSAPATWLSRERLLFGGVILLVLIGAALLTTLLVRPDVPALPLEPATVSVGTPAGQGTVVIRSFPSGAKVKVAGAWLPEGTPTRTTLPSGRPARIQVKLGDDYEIYELEVTPETGRETLVDAQLVKIRGTLTVESRPADATVFIEGRDSGRTPCTITDLAVDRPIRVRILREGFQPAEQLVEWNGRREQMLEVRLEPMSAESPRVVAALDPPPVARRAEPRYQPRYDPPPRRVSPARAPDPPPRRSPESGGKGFVTVNARPWGTVYVNGALVASETPLMRYPLASGSHTVQVYFKGDRSDKSPVKRVTVERGEETKVMF